MALTLEDVDRKLLQAKPDLLKRLVLDVTLEAELEKAGVITNALADMLKVPSQSPKQRTDLLVDSLRQGPIKRFLDFCKVVHKDRRPHLLDYLDVDITDIEAQLALIAAERYPFRSETSGPGKMFQGQRKYYQEILSRVPIYEYVMRSSLIHIEEVFTTLEILDDENDQDFRGPLHKRSQSTPISLNGVFKGIDGTVLRILLEGDPGMGKSSLLKHAAIRWAIAKKSHAAKSSRESTEGAASSDQHDDPASSPLHDKDLLIFVDKTHEGKDLNTTIWNALKGSDAEREEAMRFWREHPENCFLLVDGLDEFINQELLKELFHSLSNCKINTIISCRTGHPYLEKQLKSFNRHIKVSGFDTENAQAFVKRFINSLSSSDEGSAAEEKIHHLCTFLQSETVQGFYQNPMNCAFVSLLYYNNDITMEELSALTLAGLFQKQQQCLLKRECVKRADSQGEANELEWAAQTAAQAIHRLALHSFLEQPGKSSYSEKDLKVFGIDLKSPAIVLLHEESHLLGKSFSWPHQIIKEFHAASAVAKNEVIRFMIASKPELNQLSKFLLSVLIDTDREAARNLVTAMIIFQSRDPPCATKPPKKSSTPSALGHACSQIPILRKFLSDQNIDQLLHSPQVPFPLSEEFLSLKDVQKCLCGSTWALQNYPVIKRLVDMVLEVSSEEEHYELLRSVVHPCLPSSFSGSENSWDRLCPWEAPDGWEDSTLIKLLSLRSKVDCELHPARGRFPLLVLMYEEYGGVAYLAAKLGAWSSTKSTTYITVLVHTPGAVIAAAQHTAALSEFAHKHCRPDVVELCTRHDRWLWKGAPRGEDKADSTTWKQAIIVLNDIFQPRKGVATNPSYSEVLTVEDQKELEDSKITLLDEV